MDALELEGAQKMNMKTLWDESRAFIVGRITAGITYVTGGLTTASGAAKAAVHSNWVPAWFPNFSVDTVVLIIGAVVTVATGLVSMWATRRGVKQKEQQTRMAKAEWIMRMLREHGEVALVREFGHDWRNRYDFDNPAATDLGPLDD